MITTGRQQIRERPLPTVSDRVRPVPDQGQQRTVAPSGLAWPWRLLMVVAGSTLALLGFGLVMSVFLIFIGLPMFIVGLALVEAALKWS